MATVKKIGRLFLNNLSVNRNNDEMVLFFQVQFDKLLETLGEGQDGVRCINMCMGESYLLSDNSMAAFCHPAVAHGPGERFMEGSLVQEWRDNVPSGTKLSLQRLMPVLLREVPNLSWNVEQRLELVYDIVLDGKTVRKVIVVPGKLVNIVVA